jgi:AcrR family transcriptional regulator
MKKSGVKVGKRRAVAGRNTETPTKLIDVAIDLFAANGFKGTSIRDISKLTGMTLSNIYYYFGSKEGLLFAVLERSTRGIVEGLRRVCESSLEPLERFKLLLRTHLSLILDTYRKEAKILFLDEEHLIRISKKFQVDILNMYRIQLKNLQSLGYIDKRNVIVLAFDILGVINWHLRWYKTGGGMSLDDVTDEMLAFVLHGMLAPSRTRRRQSDKS